MKVIIRKNPSPALSTRTRLLADSQPASCSRRRPLSLVRRLGLGLALLGLFGCAVWSPGTPPAPTAAAPSPGGPATSIGVESAAATAPAATAAAATAAAAAATLPPPEALPSAALAPTDPPAVPPTLTPFPSLTPRPTFDIALYTPSATAASVSGAFGRCCTLRVHNGGSIPLWIGKQLPRGGSVIKPRWYVEFYLAQPQTVTVYWCLWVDRTKVPDDDLLGAPARGSDNLFDCRQREVQVKEGEIDIYVQ